jgi:adenosylcobinamide-GDP ribazoletransferase
MMMENDAFRQHAAALGADFRSAACFLTSVPATAFGAADSRTFDLRRSARVFPFVGGLIGAAGGLVILLGQALGLPPFVTALLAVTVMVGLTGALHEDGLDDTADGFGGGTTITHKLEIMDDSRIGSFGAIALLLSLLLRVTAIAALIPAGGIRAAAAIIAAEAVSRAAMVRQWHDLPAARPGGTADQAGPPDERAMLVAMAGALFVATITILPTFGLSALLVGVAALAAATIGCAWLSRSQIGGQTGDTLGACQQCAAIAFLIGITPFA